MPRFHWLNKLYVLFLSWQANDPIIKAGDVTLAILLGLVAVLLGRLLWHVFSTIF